MDKANSRGRPTIKRLHFLPLIAVDVQDTERQRILRRNDLAPYETIYLGDFGNLGEVFAILSEQYYLPSAYFRPRLEEFPGHPQAQQGDRYLVATSADSRLGRLDGNQLEKLKDKTSAYWNRRLPPESQPIRAWHLPGRTLARFANFLRRG